MTTDNRALWELVEKWREEAKSIVPAMNTALGNRDIGMKKTLLKNADELAAILERPVVVRDEDVERSCNAYDNFKGFSIRNPSSRPRMRAALESMVRGKS